MNLGRWYRHEQGPADIPYGHGRTIYQQSIWRSACISRRSNRTLDRDGRWPTVDIPLTISETQEPTCSQVEVGLGEVYGMIIIPEHFPALHHPEGPSAFAGCF